MIEKRNGKGRLKKWLPFYLLGLPGMAYLLINNYLPMAGLQIAFKKFNFQKGIWGSLWNNFDNFKYLFATKDAWIITRNTLLYNLVFIVAGIVFGVIVAILLNEILSKTAKKIYQTAILLPFMISMVIVAYLVYAYLSPTNGLFNSIITALGGDPVEWYSNKELWPFILVFVQQWKTIGFGMVLYLSSIVGISHDYYEAASLDGASRLKQHLKITIPLLVPTIIVLFILQMGNIFRSDFGLFYQVPMNQGALFQVTNTIDTYVFRALMVNNEIGSASAAGFYQSIVGFICVMAMNGLVRKTHRESALF